MKLGIMQPYFFPYIGYWQLINYVDKFILFDDVQYIRHGWINRNRILNKDGWKYITLSLEKHNRETKIKDVKISKNYDFKNYILNNIIIYKKIAPFFNEIFDFIENILNKITSNKIAYINYLIIKELSNYLRITTDIKISSEQNLDYSNVNTSGDWAFEISKQLKADNYVNPISGMNLFEKNKFLKNGIKLSFIESQEIIYDQKNLVFQDSLSIIDILMFNGKEETIKFLNRIQINQ